MSIDVQSSAQEAFERLATPAAAVLVLLYAVVGIVQAIATQDLMVAMYDWMLDWIAESDPEAAAEMEQEFATVSEEMALSLGLGVGPAIGLFLVGLLASILLLGLAVYAAGHEVDEPGGILPDNVGWVLLQLLVGSIVYGVLVGIGTVMLLLPGLIVAFLLMLWPAAVVLDGEWFGAAFGSSISVVTDGFVSALGIFVLIIVAYAVQFVFASVLGVLPGAAGDVLVQLLGAVVWFFTVALLARAYVSGSDWSTDGPDVVDDEWDQDASPH